MSKITASTFRDTLLVVLRDLADAEGVVSSEAATDEVLSRHGMGRDELGQDANGRDLAPLLVNQAFNKLLKRNDLALSAGYGKWALTSDGVAAADAERNTMEAVENIETSEGGGISFTVPISDLHYHSDPHIRGLAEAATPCFGRWSRTSDVCGRCSLMNACVAKTMVELEALAAKLDDRDDKIARGLEVRDEADEEISDILDIIEDEGSSEGRDWSQYIVAHETLNVEPICPHCGNAGSSDLVQVRKNPYEVKPGIYHAACFEVIK